MEENAALAIRSQKEEDLSFLWYVETHSETQRALFSGKDINRLLALAGPIKGYTEHVPDENKEFYALHLQAAKPLLEAARKRLERPQLRLIVGGKKD